MKNAAITLFAAGADTVSSTLPNSSFETTERRSSGGHCPHNILSHDGPESVSATTSSRRAGQSHRFRPASKVIVGNRRDLPYINALVKELLHWESVTPVGQYICVQNHFAGRKFSLTRFHMLQRSPIV